MEKIILAVIGVAAVYFVVRLLWKEAKGELPCNCGQSCCDRKKECPGKEKNKLDKTTDQK
ncbi:MAG TPA: FeoB-associated Cys-rich membrane protein [Negativicutes bacterium]|nr:FeoB-associated Cys-rich membrane protein [Negativicutes bacterium]